MFEYDRLLAAIYPYSYRLIFELIKKHKNVGVNRLCTVKGMIARPSVVKQILYYSEWAISTGGNNYMYVPFDESQLKFNELDYPTIVRCKSDLSAFSARFTVISKLYETLINASRPLKANDLTTECELKDKTNLIKTIKELSWATILDKERVVYNAEECNSQINDSAILHSIVIDSYNYGSKSNISSHIITDLNLNIHYPHLFPRVKNALDEITEAEGKTTVETLYWFLKDDYREIGDCFPRVTAVEAILDNASWAERTADGHYLFCE